MSTGGALPLLSVFFLFGLVSTMKISAHQSHVNGNKGGSLLLSTYYTLTQPITWLQIRWELLGSKPTALTICTVRSEETSHTETNNTLNFKQFPPEGYEHRMNIVPTNGSLLIKDLRTSDSGIYRVTVRDAMNSSFTAINVTVNNIASRTIARSQSCTDEFLKNESPTYQVQAGGLGTEPPPQCSCTNSSTVDFATSAWIILGSRASSIFITLLFMFIIRMRKRKGLQFRRKI
ncbi:HEPACAM family member 2-like isoform 1-T1 [Discoglossus pictus]